MRGDRLAAVRDIAARYPFSEAAVRWWLFNRQTNGLNTAVVRIGRRLFLDLDRFDAWLDSKREVPAE